MSDENSTPKEAPPSDDVEWGIIERKFVTQYDDFGDAYGPSLYSQDDKDYVNIYGWVKK